MSTLLLLIQSISENIALFCCAMFAGGSVYISLVEDPVAGERGPELVGVGRYEPTDDPATVEAIRAEMAPKKLIIADGHHRYETALKFGNECAAATPGLAGHAGPGSLAGRRPGRGLRRVADAAWRALMPRCAVRCLLVL